MTALLAKAFDEVTRLPDTEQNALAKWLLDELKDDRKWSKTFAESEDVLDKLVDEAIQAKRQGPATLKNLMANRGRYGRRDAAGGLPGKGRRRPARGSTPGALGPFDR
jgi:hypothetical protein